MFGANINTAEYRLVALGIDAGLSLSTVTAIHQDRHGFVWVGTQYGLNRYDGYEFTTFKNNPTQQDSLSDNWIETVAEDRDGGLWIATRMGLNHLKSGSEKFQRYYLNSSTQGGQQVKAIHEDRKGRLWVGGNKFTLYGFDVLKNEFIPHTPPTEQIGDLTNELILDIEEDVHGMLWISLRNRLLIFDPEKGEFMDRPKLDLGAGDKVNSIYISKTRPTSLWISMSLSGLFLYDIADRRMSKFSHSKDNPYSIEDNHVFSVLEGSNNGLWVGHAGGLSRLDLETNRFSKIAFYSQRGEGLILEEVNSIMKSQAGLVWLGTLNNGIAYFDPQEKRFKYFGRDPNNPNSLRSNNVATLYEDQSERLWVSTYEGTLSELREGEGFVVHDLKGDGSHGFATKGVHTISEDRFGRLWLGSRGGGLARFNPKEGIEARYLPDPKNPSSLSDFSVNLLYLAENGELWVGTSENGLSKYRYETDDFVHYDKRLEDPSSISGNSVWAMAEDSKGQMWVGTYSGLNLFNRELGTFSYFQHDPNDPRSLSNNGVGGILEDRWGTIWVATDNGLNRMSQSGSSFTQYYEKDGLPDHVIYCLLEDKDGIIWMSTNNGIARLDPRTESIKKFGVQHGLQSREFNSMARCKGKDGRLYFGGINGFNAFYPREITDNTFPSRALITDFFVRNEQKNESNQYMSSTILGTNEIQLSHSDKTVSFRFAAIHYSFPSENKIGYQLLGFDDEYIYPDVGMAQVTYTNLPTGSYTLNLKSANSDGIWSDAVRSIAITIPPPFWKHPLAQFLYLLLFLSVALFYVKINQKIKRSLEIIIRKRTQELREKNEQLINRQNQLIMQEKMASLGTLVAGVSHELQNPVNLINGFSDVCLEFLDEARMEPEKTKWERLASELYQNIGIVRKNSKRVESIVKGMAFFSRPHSSRLENVDLNSLLKPLINISVSKHSAIGFNISVKYEFDSNSKPVCTCRDSIGQVLVHILNNAIYAMSLKLKRSVEDEYSPVLKISTEVHPNQFVIAIEDNGVGVAPSNIDRAFDYFFTTWPPDSGHIGLGLPISYEIIRNMGGEIRLKSGNGLFTRVEIEIPIR